MAVKILHLIKFSNVALAGVHLVWVALCVLCRTTCVSVVHTSRYICICISHKLSGEKKYAHMCKYFLLGFLLHASLALTQFLAKTNQARRREQAQRYYISQSHTHTRILKQRQTLLGTWEPIRIPLRIPLPHSYCHSHSHSDVSARIIAAHFYECYMA